MKDKNICKFPSSSGDGEITIVNFVYEKDLSVMLEPRLSALYAINYVSSGQATLSVNGKNYFIEAGDVFFIIPGALFYLTPSSDFSYYYVSFLGRRAQKLLDEEQVTTLNPVRKSLTEVGDAFKLAMVSSSQASLNLICESVILFTFGALNKRQDVSLRIKENKLISEIRLYIDKNFYREELSLISVSKEFSYNPKYLSMLFNKVVGTGFSQYVTRVRINYALTLIEQGFTSVKDLSYMCGFKDPLYFSKVFKQKTGKSPSEYKSK
ncbi:MAG: helix-turn-helix transcriptional regulator [Clostridia bacterium]|nr:helix-turn-helix transcriptional regulator [Clostridia bacterium]